MADNPQPKNRGFLQQLLITLFAGVLAGVVAVSNTISYGATIFSGELAQFVSLGIGLALFSGLVLTAAMALTSSHPGTIAFPKAATTPILAILAAQVALDMPSSATPDEIFITVAAALAISTLGMGLFFLLFGIFGLGRLIRFMPYPVFGGFLAGAGWLLLKGGFGVMADLPLRVDTLSRWLYPSAILRWGPGLFYAIACYLLLRRFKNDAVIPITFLIGLGIFHWVGWSNGVSISEMADQGWLLGPFTSGQLWDPYLFTKLQSANWWTISRQVLTILTLVPTALISMLFNSSGVELVTRRDVNFNRELIAAGFANMLASLGGGIMGYQSASLSTLSFKMGVHNRFVGIFAAAVFVVVLFFGAIVLSLIPKLLVGGLLVYLGLTFLVRWVFESRSLLPRMEYLILLIILVVIISLGLLQGILVGVLATIILFALNYSQIDTVRSALSGVNYQSNVERAPHYQKYLHNVGDCIYILKLQGFIFFGTAHNLQYQVKLRAQEKDIPDLRFVVLDFRFVNGVDSSALNSFISMRHYAEINDYKLIFADLSPHIQHQLEKGGILDADSDVALNFSDIDYALEWCENELLNQEDITSIRIPSIKAQLSESFQPAVKLDRFLAYLEEQIIDENAPLIVKGEPPFGIFFIERGQVTVQIELESGETARLRTMGSGTVVGEIGTYLNKPASATVVTDMPCIIYFLSTESLKKMEQDEPAIAASFHKFMAELISQRLVNSNTTLQALLE